MKTEYFSEMVTFRTYHDAFRELSVIIHIIKLIS